MIERVALCRRPRAAVIGDNPGLVVIVIVEGLEDDQDEKDLFTDAFFHELTAPASLFLLSDEETTDQEQRLIRRLRSEGLIEEDQINQSQAHHGRGGNRTLADRIASQSSFCHRRRQNNDGNGPESKKRTA